MFYVQVTTTSYTEGGVRDKSALYNAQKSTKKCSLRYLSLSIKLKLRFLKFIQIYLNPVCGFKRSGWLIIGFWEAKPGFWKRLEFELFLYRFGPR